MADFTGPVAATGLLLEIDRGDPLPLHEQIERSLRDSIRAGRLGAGTRLPSSRALAAELGISRGVVTEAFSQLAAEGYLDARQGAPTRVAASVRAAAPAAPGPPLLPRFPRHLHPGTPDLSGFPRDRWLRSLRAAWKAAPIDSIGYPDPRGAAAAREALAAYLGRVRGAAADPDQMVLCAGFGQGLSLLCRLIRERGAERIALEDPGWHPQRLVAEQSGLEVVPVPVDDEGLDVEALAMSEAATVIVTPAHQFPTGVVLSPGRRAALIEWAEDRDGLIVEDDYDAELRYDGTRVGAIQGLAPERVVHIGSASKRLAPGLRIGWMLVPSWLGWDLIADKAVEDSGSEAIGQLALADFIARGELDRHVRRMRTRYAHRREALLEALARSLPGARPIGSPAGLFETVLLEPGTREAALIGAAAARGVGLEGLALHRFTPGGDPGIVLGYGNLAEPAIASAVRDVAEALSASSA